MRVVDQMGQKLEVNLPAQRIVSLVPSQTEFLHALGLDNEVIGLTKFCIHPNVWWHGKKRVGGTKNVDLEKVRLLSPDLIIGNKEENSKENIADLKEICPVWMSDISNLEEAYEMMSELGKLTNREVRAEEIVAQIKKEFSELQSLKNKPKVAYFIWKKPWMCVGKDTFVNHLLEVCGFENAIVEDRYPAIEESDFPDVDFVFLSSEPYPFKEKEMIEMKKFFSKAKIVVVDGEYFSWYGSRLLLAPRYFNSLLATLHG
jgi:ABC-type Fe3+-hydroxamate transport system substrate-binding protein